MQEFVGRYGVCGKHEAAAGVLCSELPELIEPPPFPKPDRPLQCVVQLGNVRRGSWTGVCCLFYNHAGRLERHWMDNLDRANSRGDAYDWQWQSPNCGTSFEAMVQRICTQKFFTVREARLSAEEPVQVPVMSSRGDMFSLRTTPLTECDGAEFRVMLQRGDVDAKPPTVATVSLWRRVLGAVKTFLVG